MKLDKSQAGKLGYLASREKHKQNNLNFIQKYLNNPKYCHLCEQPIPYKKRANKFCSKTCSATYNNKQRIRTQESRQAISELAKARWEEGTWPILRSGYGKDNPRYITGDYAKVQKKCVLCHTEFESIPQHDFCSTECSNKGKRTRNGAWYFCVTENKQVYLQSSWEIEIAKWLDDQNIPWVRPKPLKYLKEGVLKNYYPDFYLIDLDIYLDPKNPFCMEKDADKMKSVLEYNSITLLYGDKDKMKEDIKDLCPPRDSNSQPAHYK